MSRTAATVPESIRFTNGVLQLLDQRQLPDLIVWVDVADIDAGFRAIKDMVVRGAPAIGIAAAYTLAVAARQQAHLGAAKFDGWLQAAAARLRSARPTAVNLAWAVDRLVAVAQHALDPPRTLEEEARRIHDEDRAICRGIAAAGVDLITPGCGVLTHCNAGALAVSELGTATAPMYLAHQRGIPFRVFADETRPVLQGARLTAWELASAGIDVTLICDNMAAHLMAQGLIDCVIVGTDRVTANGDVVNKIGTLGVAILARYFAIPFYVACPSSTFDPLTASGEDVIIEERSPNEVIEVRGTRIAPRDIKVRNPAFDVTNAALVTGIITEHGLVKPPFATELPRLFQRSAQPTKAK